MQNITIENKQITALSIYNTTKKCLAYSFGDVQKPDKPSEKNEAPQVRTCTDCGKAVDENMAARTQKAFGVVLCKDCGLKRSGAK